MELLRRRWPHHMLGSPTTLLESFSCYPNFNLLRYCWEPDEDGGGPAQPSRPRHTQRHEAAGMACSWGVWRPNMAAAAQSCFVCTQHCKKSQRRLVPMDRPCPARCWCRGCSWRQLLRECQRDKTQQDSTGLDSPVIRNIRALLTGSKKYRRCSALCLPEGLSW